MSPEIQRFFQQSEMLQEAIKHAAKGKPQPPPKHLGARNMAPLTTPPAVYRQQKFLPSLSGKPVE